MFETFLATDEANKASLLLVHERYTAQLAPFVKDSSSRLDYVRPEVERIIDEVCDKMGSEREYVATRFDDYLASAVLQKDKKVKREKLKTNKG